MRTAILTAMTTLTATATATAIAPAPLLSLTPGATPRVAIVTGSYGAGHNSAAREIARVLSTAGCEVETHDIVTLLPWRLGPLLRSAYYVQLRRQPASWGTTLQLLEPGRRAHRVVTRLLGPATARVVEAVQGSDLVITTHPFGAQGLGHARLAGTLDVPAVAYLTDTSVHSLWIHPGIDLNLGHPRPRRVGSPALGRTDRSRAATDSSQRARCTYGRELPAFANR